MPDRRRPFALGELELALVLVAVVVSLLVFELFAPSLTRYLLGVVSGIAIGLTLSLARR